ncbi:MAG TPA: GTPase Era [Casimicrobiaceae bacterium]|jgi:GTP-binding protein Era|nr:GTPase Era [Casimicrobiaceae bacterium]
MSKRPGLEAPESAAAGAFRCGQVAIVGRPSVGKSTLVNALVGARISITSKRPQTTRYRIRGILTTVAAQFIFVDTPGFQAHYRSRLNERMNRAVRDSLADVDVIVVVVDAARLTEADRDVLALLPDGVPVIVAVNKVDRLPDKTRLLPLLATIGAARDFAAIVPISAEKGWQLDALTAEIAGRLPPGPGLYAADDLTDRDERFLAAEYLREKIFRLLGDEVPYAAAVVIDTFAHEADLRRIHATVFVEKASQRAILLGEGGARMKAIASAARRDMERMFGGKVFLEVWVRVKSGWANDERMLTRLGY